MRVRSRRNPPPSPRDTRGVADSPVRLGLNGAREPSSQRRFTRRFETTVAQTQRTPNRSRCSLASVFRAGDRAGLNQEGINMKKFLLAGVALAALSGSAVAADLARPAYAPPPPMYSWTGLYWGVNVGYSWGRDKNQWNLVGFGTVCESQKMDGVIGGFQSGYNYQFGQWVLGLETDIQASGQKGSSVYGIAPGVTLSADHKLP